MLTVRQALLTIVAVCVAIFLLFMTWRPVPAQVDSEANYWWYVTIELLAQSDRIGNEPDRRFLRQMRNELAVTHEAVPTVTQQRWLLSIQRELKRR